MLGKTLIFIPTYNEKDNVGPMCEQLLALRLDADIVFMDDNSPDGTGALLDALAKKHPRVRVLHRPGKNGIGSAHIEGILWSYDQGYETLITMDCDFTHSPADVRSLIAQANDTAVTLGSRYLQADSLPGWNLHRRFLTYFGHFLTYHLLGLRHDATGAFRLYNLRQIPRALFEQVEARGYAFFFESLFRIKCSGYSVKEVPIVLPARTYGSSKMSWREATRSAVHLVKLSWQNLRDPRYFRVKLPPAAAPDLDPALIDPQGWDDYWSRQSQPVNIAYQRIAEFYRNRFIKPRLERYLSQTFSKGAQVLHAGCGGGQVDMDVHPFVQVTALDISPGALDLYRRHNPLVHALRHGSILQLPFADGSFDGVYNLGVMEHFTAAEIRAILAEFHRVTKPGGQVVLFWPHAWASSVLFLRGCHWLLDCTSDRQVRFHPPEISLLQSEDDGRQMLRAGGFELVNYEFGIVDGLVQAVLIGRKADANDA